MSKINIDKIFVDFYNDNPLRFGMRIDEIAKKTRLNNKEIAQILEHHSDKYEFNGIVYYKKNRNILFNEKLEDLKTTIIEYFDDIKKIDLHFFEISNSVNQSAIINIINYLIDVNQLVNLHNHTYYVNSAVYKKYLKKVIDELYDSPKSTYYLKEKLELNREKTVIFLEYLDSKRITQFQSNYRTLLKIPKNII